MRTLFHRLHAEHGMLYVLVLLCALFSALTLSEQTVSGDPAATQIANAVRPVLADGKALIIVRDRPDDLRFARLLESKVHSPGPARIEIVAGDPAAARRALQSHAAAGTRLTAIATNSASARWLVLENPARDFPGLGSPKVIAPTSYWWPTFLKIDNLLNIANQIAIIAILAIGMTMVIVTGGIDLSVGSLLALAAVLATWLVREYGGALEAGAWAMFGAGLAAIALCAAVGAASGFVATRFGVPPFIVTLSVMLIASGLAYTIAQNQSIYQIPESFTWLGRGGGPLGIPFAVLLMVALYIMAHIVMSRTRIGRYLYAVGGNREAAQISGVPVRGVVIFAYTVSGALAGLGGVIMASNLKSGSATYGGMYELYVIAAVVVGGASLSGGKGHMANTLMGALSIAIIQNGMNLTNVESQLQKVVLGAVILAAVLLDKCRHS